MDERKIAFTSEGQAEISKKNKRDFLIGLVLFFISVYIAAKFGAGTFAALIVGFICIGIPVLTISTRSNEYHEKRTKKNEEALIKQYGEYSIKIDSGTIDSMTFLFPSSQVLVINGTKFNFSEIIDFSLNEMASYKTTTSTSSMLGRGLGGGVMFGGVGELAGANSASSKTVKETAQYDFNIIIDDFSNPNFRCTYHHEDRAKTLYSILKLIIDKNQSKNEG